LGSSASSATSITGITGIAGAGPAGAAAILSSSAHVFGPTIPSGTIPWSRWKARTAASVFGPNVAADGSIPSARWISCTRGPLSPRRVVGRPAASVLGMGGGLGMEPVRIAATRARKADMSKRGSTLRPFGSAYSRWPAQSSAPLFTCARIAATPRW